MHFWINKGSQGRGFNGRYVPPSISAGSRRNHVCGGLYPKPMVTPVHRFQSIESVASGGHRHSRAPPYHTRFPTPSSTQQQYNNAAAAEYGGSTSAPRMSNNHRPHRVSLEYVATGEASTLTPGDRVNVQTSRLKCGVWVVIGLIPFFIAAAKYYFNGENMGLEALTFCSVVIFILLIGAIFSFFEAFGTKRVRRESFQISSEQNETFEDSSQVPSNNTPIHTELPPPPYHVAVMLPTQNERLTIIQDSPPPTYEKAVT